MKINMQIVFLTRDYDDKASNLPARGGFLYFGPILREI
jgi:hypothetical protein